MMTKDLRGEQIGDWTVLRISDCRERGLVLRWECRCVCGTEREVLASSLRTGRSTGCGCRRYAALAARQTKHGHSKRGRESRTYQSWKHMLQRCYNPNADDYHFYGARGIRICRRWHKFENFLADMGECPRGLTIDRADNDGPYEKTNCRWATRAEQVANKRGNYVKGQPGLRGEAAPASKLTSEQVVAIRASSDSQRVIAKAFGVSQPLISMIRSGQLWNA